MQPRQDTIPATLPLEAEAPYFDNTLNAWILTRHADILAAFRSSSLSPASPNINQPSPPIDESARLKMRTETMDALSPAQLDAWHTQLTPEIHALAANLPTEEPVDLMDAYARPLCLSLAAMVTRIPRSNAESLCPFARKVSAAAAEPRDPALEDNAKYATAKLRGHFPSGPEPLRDSGFVGLSQTMPCLLGNAWFALMQYPQQWALLHQHPDLIEQAIEELFRYAGLVRTLARTVTADIDLKGTLIRKDERILLRIIAANHDPARFSHPNQVDITRRGGGHLSLGAGPHACVAAGLIRMAAIAITQPLIQRFANAKPDRPVEWQGGSGFRFPKSLWAILAKAE
jgi:cytochrome P450